MIVSKDKEIVILYVETANHQFDRVKPIGWKTIKKRNKRIKILNEPDRKPVHRHKLQACHLKHRKTIYIKTAKDSYS